MTNEQAIDIIRNEYKCVDSECDIERSCGKCPYMMLSKEPILQAYDMAIKALSQEPTDTWSIKDVADTFKKHGLLREQEPCTDAVSREAVIEWLKDKDIIKLKSQEDNARKELGALTSVNPQPCDDAISRDALKKMLIGLDKWHIKNKQFVNVGLLYDDVFFGIEQLPSVNPQKSGHWIQLDYQRGKFECSECHTQGYVDTCMYEPTWKYCPNCGCRMVEPQERAM